MCCQNLEKGIGAALLRVAEQEAFIRSDVVGLGVGLYRDYGPAQQLYVSRGYLPDGCGVTYQYKYIEPGATVTLDDDLILWFTKTAQLEDRQDNISQVLSSIKTFEEFDKFKTEVEAVEQVAKRVLRQHHLPDASLKLFSEGTNIVFEYDNHRVIKIFPPMHIAQYQSELIRS